MNGFKQQSRQALKQLGKEVTLENTETTQTSHGSKTSESTQTIKAIPDPGSRSLSFGEVFGAEVDADHAWIIDDRDGQEITDGGGDYASRIIDGDETYVIIDAENSAEHGLMLLECEREDNP